MGPLVSQLTAPGHTGRAAPAPAAQPDTGPPPRFPTPGMPHKADLDYLKVALELGLLLLAVPYLIHHLANRPRATMRKAADHHLGT